MAPTLLGQDRHLNRSNVSGAIDGIAGLRMVNAKAQVTSRGEFSTKFRGWDNVSTPAATDLTATSGTGP